MALFQQLLLRLEFRVVHAGFSPLTTHDRKPLSPVLCWCKRSVVIDNLYTLVYSYIELYTYILSCSISCGLHPLWIYQTRNKLN